jgi:hypothetical protein
MRAKKLPPGETIRPDELLSCYINQNGVMPGERKLAQFQAALRIRGTPALYAQDGARENATVYVKLFDPCGSATWFLTEWDGEDQAFGFVTGLQFDEYGYVSLRELAFVGGALGIGIEIDTFFRPKILKAAIANGD